MEKSTIRSLEFTVITVQDILSSANATGTIQNDLVATLRVQNDIQVDIRAIDQNGIRVTTKTAIQFIDLSVILTPNPARLNHRSPKKN